MSNFTPAMPSELITRERVSSQVHRYLRDKILRGELAEGTRLVETDIAAELRVSRTPVREALAQLQGRDLVRPLQAGGFAVADYRRELMDILDIRVALETHAVRSAAQRIGAAEVARLDDICAEMERLPAEAVAERADLNRRFHETLIGTAGNRRLVALVNDYQDYFGAVQRLFDTEAIKRTQREHRAIVAALRARDSGAAAEAVADHIAGAGEQIMRAVGTGRPADAPARQTPKQAGGAHP